MITVKPDNHSVPTEPTLPSPQRPWLSTTILMLTSFIALAGKTVRAEEGVDRTHQQDTGNLLDADKSYGLGNALATHGFFPRAAGNQEPNLQELEIEPDKKAAESEIPEDIKDAIWNIIDSIKTGKKDSLDQDLTGGGEDLKGYTEEELLLEALDIIREQIEMTEETIELRSLMRVKDRLEQRKQEIREELLKQEQEKFSLPDWQTSMFLVGVAGALLMTLNELRVKGLGYLRAMMSVSKVANLWSEYQEKVSIDQPPTIAGNKSIAEIKGSDLSKCEGIEERLPEGIAATLKKFGLEPNMIVWAGGIQTTGDSIDFSDISYREVGVNITNLDGFKYLATHIRKRFIERNPNFKSFVTSAVDDAQIALLEDRWTDVSHIKNKSAWRSACRYFSKWTNRLGLEDDSQFFKDLDQASRLPKKLFDDYLALEKKIKHVSSFPFSMERKLDEIMIKYELLVEKGKDAKLSDQQRSSLNTLLNSTGKRIESALDSLTNLQTANRISTNQNSVGNSKGNTNIFSSLNDSGYFKFPEFKEPYGSMINDPEKIIKPRQDPSPIERARNLARKLQEGLNEGQ